MKPSKAFFVSRNIFVMKGRNWKMRYGKHRTHARIVGQWAHAFCKLYGYAKQGKLRKCHGHSDDSDCGPHSQLTSEFPTHLHSGWWPRSRICWESPGMEKKILEILYNSRSVRPSIGDCIVFGLVMAHNTRPNLLGIIFPLFWQHRVLGAHIILRVFA